MPNKSAMPTYSPTLIIFDVSDVLSTMAGQRLKSSLFLPEIGFELAPRCLIGLLLCQGVA